MQYLVRYSILFATSDATDDIAAIYPLPHSLT